jgi:Flp pilus assembly protein TadD
MLAELRDRLGNYDGAEQSLRQALAIDANNVVALNNLAYLFALRETHLPEAQALIDRAIAQAGPRAAHVDTRALVHLASGQNVEALADTEIAITSEAAAVHFFHDARAQLANGRSAAARESWKKATQLGLTGGHIHLLEQPAFRALQAELDAKGR